MTLKVLIRYFLIAWVIIGFGANAYAQHTLLQNTIDKLEGYKNFRYNYVYKQKEVLSDTLIINQNFNLLKVPEDPILGYYFKNEIQYPGSKNLSVEVYNGKDLISLSPADSTYTIESKKSLNFYRPLPKQLNWMKEFSEKNPSKLVIATDTVVNSINSYHLILNTRDTIINKDHLYTRQHLFIDKRTGLPVAILTRAKTADFGKEAADYYVQENYSNFETGVKDIDTAYFSIPRGYKPSQKKEQPVLLPPGTMAPQLDIVQYSG